MTLRPDASAVTANAGNKEIYIDIDPYNDEDNCIMRGVRIKGVKLGKETKNSFEECI